MVVILSDGWERGDPALVGREMERLGRLAHRIVWVNPRVGASAFSVRAGGMVAALPHCDALVSGHSFAALGEVVEAIGARPPVRPAGGRRGRRPPTEAVEEEETWASATPVPGSSVAMPSGYGPSRARPRPGGAPMTTTTTASIRDASDPTAPPHPQGGPRPAFCDLEDHNVLTAHQERQRLASAENRDDEEDR